MKTKIYLNKPLLNILQTLALIILIASVSNAANGVVDSSYDPAVALEANVGNVNAQALAQPDGKVLVFGFESLNSIGGNSTNTIVRLNADGTFDQSFHCECDDFSFAITAVLQTDGKILIGGSFGNARPPRLARLNPDGSRDNTFTSPFNQPGGAVTYTVRVWDVQADGKIFVSLSASGVGGSSLTLYRLNPNGSLDGSFNPVFFNRAGLHDLYWLESLAGGKVLIGGNHPNGKLFRLNSDGTVDSTFNIPSFTGGTTNFVFDFEFQSDGKLLVFGGFGSVNGVARNGFVRLNTDQSVDLQFDPNITLSSFEVLSNDKILTSRFGIFTKLNADGSVDNSFNPTINANRWYLDDLERIIYIRQFAISNVFPDILSRATAAGQQDTTFKQNQIGSKGEIDILALQNDGKLLFAGNFSNVKNTLRKRIARINVDGTLDETFESPDDVSQEDTFDLFTIRSIKPQPDGKILVGGSSFGSTDSLTRLNSDGTEDPTFDTDIGFGASGQRSIFAIELLPNGKILMGGIFTINNSNQSAIARLNPDGSLDTTFNPLFSNSSQILSIIPLSDGKIIVGGSFGGVNGVNRNDLIRLNADGTLDTSFASVDIPFAIQVLRQADGKYLVVIPNKIVRFNADGTTDNSWQVTTFQNGGASDLIVLPDGRVVAVGNFDSVNNLPRKRIVILSPNGAVGQPLLVDNVEGDLNEIVLQADGDFIIGGEFIKVGGFDRSSIAKISVSTVSQTPDFDFDGDGKADVSVFRPSENKWYILKSSDQSLIQPVFAIAGDIPTPADYDGDGKTDIGIFRPATGDWWYLSSINGAQVNSHLGQNGDIPLPSDFDGDGKADTIVYRSSENNFYRYSSSNGQFTTVNFGISGDKPVIGDFDGDGKTDTAIYRPSTGDWWWKSSIDGIQRATNWGLSTDIPAPADYDGDGITDFAVYRPSEGGWYIFNSSTGIPTTMAFGIAEDIPVPADYDGDGKADIAVFRPSTGIWYLFQSTEGLAGLQFGISTDIPIPASFLQ